MLTDKHATRGAHTPAADIELDDYIAEAPVIVPPTDRDSPVHRDQYAQFSHELTDGAAEAVTRTLVRVVPLAYGSLLGYVADDLAVGLILGLLLSAAFDMSMGRQSGLRTLYRRVTVQACPFVAALAHGVAAAARRVGLPIPAVVGEMRCRA